MNQSLKNERVEKRERCLFEIIFRSTDLGEICESDHIQDDVRRFWKRDGAASFVSIQTTIVLRHHPRYQLTSWDCSRSSNIVWSFCFLILRYKYFNDSNNGLSTGFLSNVNTNSKVLTNFKPHAFNNHHHDSIMPQNISSIVTPPIDHPPIHLCLHLHWTSLIWIISICHLTHALTTSPEIRFLKLEW